MKILFVSHSGRRSGGAQNVMLSIIKYLMKIGIECHCILPEHGRFFDEMVACGVKCHRIKYSWWAGFEFDTLYKIVDFFLNARSSTDKFVEVIQKNGINLVVTNTITVAEGALAAKLCGVKHIWYIHEMLSKDPKLKHMVHVDFLYYIILQLSHKVIAISDTVKNEIVSHIDYSLGLNYFKNEIVVVYNGVDIPNVELAPLNGYNVLSAGGVCRRKGQYPLLKAAEIVIKEIPEARFTMAGMFWEKDYNHLLLNERVRMKIERKFSFLKWVEDMDSYYRSGALLVSPALFEPFGLALLEGMAHGLPVVATESGGPEEIVVDGETGFLVPVGDTEQMASRILQLLKDKNLAKRMGAAGRERVRNNFSRDKFVTAFTNAIIGEQPV